MMPLTDTLKALPERVRSSGLGEAAASVKVHDTGHSTGCAPNRHDLGLLHRARLRRGPLAPSLAPGGDAVGGEGVGAS